MQLPMKTRILQYALEKGSSFTKYDVEMDLRKEYPNERLFSLKTIDDYLEQLMGVGFIGKENIGFDDKGELLISFKATSYGQTRYKYVKGKGPYGIAK